MFITLLYIFVALVALFFGLNIYINVSFARVLPDVYDILSFEWEEYVDVVQKIQNTKNKNINSVLNSYTLPILLLLNGRIPKRKLVKSLTVFILLKKLVDFGYAEEVQKKINLDAVFQFKVIELEQDKIEQIINITEKLLSGEVSDQDKITKLEKIKSIDLEFQQHVKALEIVCNSLVVYYIRKKTGGGLKRRKDFGKPVNIDLGLATY